MVILFVLDPSMRMVVSRALVASALYVATESSVRFVTPCRHRYRLGISKGVSPYATCNGGRIHVQRVEAIDMETLIPRLGVIVGGALVVALIGSGCMGMHV